MPLNKYFQGHGQEVMANMRKQYGDKKGKSVFYATANKKHQAPKRHSKRHHKLAKMIGASKRA